MLRLILICVMAIVLAACSGGSQGGKGETGKSGDADGARPATTNAAKVLVRERHTVWASSPETA